MAWNWMLPLKLFGISAAVVFAALGVKASVPLATTHLSPLWNLCFLCVKPPFLYLLVNAIIISILASSKYFHHSFDTTPPPPPLSPIPQPPLIHLNPDHVINPSISSSVEDESQEEEKSIVVEESTCAHLQTMDSTEISPEFLWTTDKPLVSSRFSHRKPLKSTPEGGKALRVVGKQKRHDTLENTWKAITEGRPVPLSRHVKKCDTWQNRGSAGPHPEVTKAETFKERTSQPVSVRLRKEPSLSQDELNRRVEAFIHKFNEQMRLQRQESLNQYMQMINRDAD